MTDCIDDDLLDLAPVSGSPAEAGRKIAARNTFSHRTTMMFYGPQPSPDAIAEAVAAARA